MNEQNRFAVVLSAMTVLALLAACARPEPTATMVPEEEPPVVPADTQPAPAGPNAGITVTFEGDRCIYRGPDQVFAGRIPITLDVEDQKDHKEYGLAVVTLNEGKTIEDLDAWPSTDQPPWTQLHGLLDEIPQGNRADMTIAAFEGPLFLVCFTAYPITKSGTLGPVQVVHLVTNAEALAGIWHETTPSSFGGEVYRQFAADGTYRMGSSLEELEAQPRVEGEFWFEGDQIVMRDVAAQPSFDACVQEGQVGRYNVARLANGSIRFVEVQDDCRERVGMLSTREMEPLSAFPTGRFAAQNGDWALAFDDDGSFRFSESGVMAASGTFSIQGNELTWETDSYCEKVGKAIYTWTFQSDTLLFQVKGEDKCADRLAVLDGVPYHASPEPSAIPHAQNAATAVAERGDTTWDMVVLGDSLVADDYSILPEAYAALIQEDLGVKVDIQNLAVGGETTRSVLTNVQKYPWYREPLQEAEIVLISVGGGDLPLMEKRFFGGECGGADNQNCLRQQLEESQADWDALLDEIASLADPSETLIRPVIPGILEFYARAYKDQPEEVEMYNSFVVALYEHMARSCAEAGIPVLDLYALYDGPSADPTLPEISGTGDGVHVDNEGDAVIAALLRDLGYKFLTP